MHLLIIHKLSHILVNQVVSYMYAVKANDCNIYSRRLHFSSVPENSSDLPIVWFGYLQLIGPQSFVVSLCAFKCVVYC